MKNEIAMLPMMQKMGGIFHKYGIQLFTVGGYVRNSLLGLPVSDFDVCSVASPLEVLSILKGEPVKVIEKAPEFGTIEIHLLYEGKSYSFEHTTFRRDYYGDGGNHRPKLVSFTKSMAEDALRRDFTINALYADTRTGEVQDITKRGLADLAAGLIAAAHPDPYETLKDDGLRLLRLVRFACELGFSIEERLFATAKQNALLLSDISKERIQTEIKKIMLSDMRYPAFTKGKAPHKKGMYLIYELGLLKYIFPSLARAQGIAQKSEYHAYDVLKHCIETFALARPELDCRLAALLHDSGKPVALKVGGNMYGHDAIGAVIAAKELKTLAFDKKTTDTVAILIKNHMFDLENKAKPSTVRKKAAELGAKNFTKLIDLRRADFIGSGKLLNRVESADKWEHTLKEMLEKKTPFSENELNISGKEIMTLLNIQEGQTVGLIKKRLLELCIQKPSQNTLQNLKIHAKNIYKEVTSNTN